ncbi:MAG TPA: hypothetical protein DCM86_02300 [Verrucomicrobiales bacterium]|nr:hypothetical protein [Verrucomicrobiales bacterium]
MKTKSLLLALGATLLTGAATQAATPAVLVVTGGNASKAVLYDRTTNALLSSVTITANVNTDIRTFVGTPNPTGPLASSGLGPVTIHFVLNGAALGLQDLKAGNPVTTATGASLPPNFAVSGTLPDTIGIDPSVFTSQQTFVIPFGYVKNNNLANTLHGVTNLTQRQAVNLQDYSGLATTSLFGGESTTDTLYVIGRDPGAAVRRIIDANIYYSGSPTFYTTNAQGQPIVNPLGGHNAGNKVVADLKVIPNAIGTLGSADFNNAGFQILAYEGFLPTVYNVANGFYPIWGYEGWYTLLASPPGANQQTILNALYSTVTDTTYQHTAANVFSNAGFVPLGDLHVSRAADGGPITPL